MKRSMILRVCTIAIALFATGCSQSAHDSIALALMAGPSIAAQHRPEPFVPAPRPIQTSCVTYGTGFTRQTQCMSN